MQDRSMVEQRRERLETVLERRDLSRDCAR